LRRQLEVFAVALTVLLLGSGLLLLEGRLAVEREEASAQGAAHSAARGLERAVDHAMAAAYALALDVRRSDWTPERFEETATALARWYPDVDCFQLAPAGVVRHIHPLAGHEGAVGHDLLADPGRRPAAQAAIDSGELTLAGPVDLIQGGRAVIGRLPIFVGEGSSQEFWGFAIVLVRLEPLADTLRSSLEHAGWAWELWRIEPEARSRSSVLAGPAALDGRPAQAGVTVPNGSWVLDVAPAGGWSSGVRPLGWMGLVLVSLMAGAWGEGRRRSAERMTHLAFHDSLTGVQDRVVLEHTLVRAIARARRTRTMAAVAVVDLDDFKDINDRYGHAAGDAVLVEVARRLLRTVREVDSVIRLGGDEFVLVVTDLGDPEDAEVLCRRVMTSMAEPIELKQGRACISASVGAAVHPRDGEDPEALLQQADAAMYRAKEAGKNRIEMSGSYSLSIDTL